jgi:hypothetical protein
MHYSYTACVVGHYCYTSTELDATDYNIAVIGNFQEHTARGYLQYVLQHVRTYSTAIASDKDWSAVYEV